MDETQLPLSDDWTEGPPRRAAANELVVDVDGFEGPLDLLLALARSQKVDLARISILALAEQYLSFVDRLRQIRLDLAADYLVMAAWLAYLKSRLLLPPDTSDDEPTGEELATALAFRLRRLEAMREAAARLMNGNRLGRDVFGRGMPEPVEIEKKSEFTAELYDLLSAYAGQRGRQAVVIHHIRKRAVWSLAEAREVLNRLVGRIAEWTPLDRILLPYFSGPETRRTAIASSFGATLEMVREGRLEIGQKAAFAPIYLRDPPINKNTTGQIHG
jgi:segregation and condensation protein A